MFSKIVIFLGLFCIVAVVANDEMLLDDQPPSGPYVHVRQRRQENKNLPQLKGGGGGNSKTGYDISLDARQHVYTSPNKRHEVDVTGGFSKHYGGPYGNSPGDYRGGLIYRYRF